MDKEKKFGNARYIFHEDGSIDLISYTTLVCTIDPDGWLTCTGTYSPTTRTHISNFMKRHGKGVSYYTAKRCYEHDERFNVNTWEVLPL